MAHIFSTLFMFGLEICTWNGLWWNLIALASNPLWATADQYIIVALSMFTASECNVCNAMRWNQFSGNQIAFVTCTSHIDWFTYTQNNQFEINHFNVEKCIFIITINATFNGIWWNLAIGSWYPARWTATWRKVTACCGTRLPCLVATLLRLIALHSLI